MRLLVTVGAAVLILTAFCSAEAVDVRLRLGQGGLRDDRVPDGKLGGGQLALDVQLARLPLVVSIATEYYKKSPEASHPYEIHGMLVAYLLYRQPLPTTWNSDAYIGGGIAVLEVPRSDGNDTVMERAIAFDAACGISARAFWKLGVYIEAKYIYSRKTAGTVRIVDFSNVGVLAGITLNFGWWSS